MPPEVFNFRRHAFGPIRRAGTPPRRMRMVEVTEMAREQIAEYFKGKKVQPIRIFLNEGG